MVSFPSKKGHESLLPGLNYVQKHGITQREITVLMCLMEKPMTAKQISVKTKIHEKTLQKFIQTLRLKGLIALKDRDSNHVNTYEFNPNSV